MLIESRPAVDPELAVLVAAQQRETGEPGLPRDDPAYLVAVVAGRAVACGGWWPLGAGVVAELAGLYVRPAFRGRGIARQLIVALEEQALAAGRSVIRLAAASVPAITLYRSAGYRQIPAYGRHAQRPADVCFELRLDALDRLY